RKDAQVKIRGFRIELTEVEGVIREYPQIKDATVQAFDEPNGNGKFICAYIVSDEKVDVQCLNAFIEERKPPYMVPAVTMQIDRIPLNQNQKVNRKALPKPERQAETYVMPQTDMQQQLYDIVAEIIGNKDFGITNNLFYYGLTSITAIKLAVRINNVLGIAVQNRQLKENNTIKKLAALLEAQSGVETVKFETLADYPLTQSQTGIYVECSANEGTTIYNIPYLLQLSPEVDIDKLEKALRQAVENHKEIKRHLTVNADGEVRQKPMPDADIEITRSKTDEATLLADTSQLVKPYKLLDANLYRFEIIETESRPYLYLDFHHIISDGTSMNILVEDINHIYNGEPVEEEEIDAFECAQLEEYERTTEAYTKAKSYYDSLFGDVEDIAGFATDDLAVAPEEKIAWNTLHDDRQSTSAIRDYCRKNGVTENAFFNAVFGFVLAKYNNASEAVFATIYNGRNDSRKVRTMDMMVKTMPCRFRMSDGAAVIDIIRSQASQIEDLMANDLFSFAEANHEYGVTADTLLAYQGDSFGVNELAGRPATAIPVSLNTAKADITLQIFINDGCLEYKAEYNPRKYSADTIENILSSISESARQFAVCKNINDVAMLDKRHAAVLDEFNHTECEYDTTQTIPSLFRKAAAMYPDNDCVVYDGRVYTYKEVDAISDNIAWMIHERGIGREQVVSVLIPRCEYMAIASLAIVKAGAAYQPLDPTYPEERLNFMMKDADARLLICDRSLRPKVNEYQGDIIYIDELSTPVLGASAPSPSAPVLGESASSVLPLSPLPSSLFILLYTSGSTGTPKGCQIEHRNIVAFCHWYQREYHLTSESRASAYASYGFDANMMDTWPALTIGASVHIISEDLRMNLVALNDYFEHNGITHSLMTTQIGRQFATEIDNHSLHHLNVGGEKLVPCNPPKNFTLHNAYGPTEGTIVATSFVVDRLYANV
ncbi:MAG: AMP-binding protein, partial [Prevotella sp.]